mgnify:CR=1 FL=1
MIATIINAAAVLAGSCVGLLLGKLVTEEKQTVVMTGAGVVTVFIGVYMGLKTTAFVELVLALIVGGLAGSALHLEDRIEGLGNRIERAFTVKPTSGNNADAENTTIEHTVSGAKPDQKNSLFAKGFLDASVLFCAGAMTILGAIEAGVNKNYTLLLTKSVLDGFMAIVFTSIYGLGVAFAALSILVYQGLLTALGIILEPLLNEQVLMGISGAGGCLVFMIGVNLLKLKKIKTADFLPALILMPLVLMVSNVINK